jgi:hypothetical protein
MLVDVECEAHALPPTKSLQTLWEELSLNRLQSTPPFCYLARHNMCIIARTAGGGEVLGALFYYYTKGKDFHLNRQHGMLSPQITSDEDVRHVEKALLSKVIELCDQDKSRILKTTGFNFGGVDRSGDRILELLKGV